MEQWRRSAAEVRAVLVRALAVVQALAVDSLAAGVTAPLRILLTGATELRGARRDIPVGVLEARLRLAAVVPGEGPALVRLSGIVRVHGPDVLVVAVLLELGRLRPVLTRPVGRGLSGLLAEACGLGVLPRGGLRRGAGTGSGPGAGCATGRRAAGVGIGRRSTGIVRRRALHRMIGRLRGGTAAAALDAPAVRSLGAALGAGRVVVAVDSIAEGLVIQRLSLTGSVAGRSLLGAGVPADRLIARGRTCGPGTGGTDSRSTGSAGTGMA